MKLKNLFYFLLALPLVFAACDNGGDEVVPPALTLTSEATLSFEAEGGNGEISYKLENGVEGDTVTATANVGWIKDIVCGEKVTFVVEANELAEEREGMVTVAYAELSFDVTVKQAAAEVKEPSGDPELIRESIDTVTLASAGADAVIIYSLKNPVEGVEVTATPSVAWITITEMNTEECKIRYHADATDSTEEREGKITVAYGEYGSFDVTVKQRGGSLTFEVFGNENLRVDHYATTQSVSYKISFPEDAAEEVAVTVNNIEPADAPAWITNITNTKDEAEADANFITGTITFDIAEHTTKGDRVAEMVVSYAGNEWKGKITQKDNFPNDVEFDLVSLRAEKGEGTTWTLILEERNQNHGNPVTHIVFNLAENKRYIPTGKYSIEDGTIVAGSVGETKTGSVYRYNTTGVAYAINTCNIEFVVDMEAKTTKISGSFLAEQMNAGDASLNEMANITIKYEGKVDGFDISDDNSQITEPITSLNISAIYNEYTKWTIYNLVGKSADGKLSYDINIVSTTNSLDTGKYLFQSDIAPQGDTKIQCCEIESSTVTYRGATSNFVASGVGADGKERNSAVTVVNNEGEYTITLNAIDAYGRDFKCAFKGAVEIMQ